MGALLPYRGDYYLWKYVPSRLAAVIFVILFAAMSCLHVWKQVSTKARFTSAFTIGVFFEVIGYVGRAKANNATNKLMPFILQSSFTLLAPALFAASIYMTLGRVMRCVRGEHLSIIKAGHLTKIFVCGDILAFWIQGGASGLMFNTKTAQLGFDIVLVGLIVQIASFGLFFVCIVVWYARIRSQPTHESYNNSVPWQQSVWMLIGVSIAIFGRSIFRVIEYAGGQSGYSISHEWCIYIFDAVPMFLVTVFFYMYYPSRLQTPVYANNVSDEERLGVPMKATMKLKKGSVQ